jgi:mannose-1-phosphate guanylyltransferase
MTMIYPVILSGRSGTRLWPLSRALYPTQLIRFNGHDVSFLGGTLKRLQPASGFQAPTLLCNNDHRIRFDKPWISIDAMSELAPTVTRLSWSRSTKRRMPSSNFASSQ